MTVCCQFEFRRDRFECTRGNSSWEVTNREPSKDRAPATATTLPATSARLRFNKRDEVCVLSRAGLLAVRPIEKTPLGYSVAGSTPTGVSFGTEDEMKTALIRTFLETRRQTLTTSGGTVDGGATRAGHIARCVPDRGNDTESICKIVGGMDCAGSKGPGNYSLEIQNRFRVPRMSNRFDTGTGEAMTGSPIWFSASNLKPSFTSATNTTPSSRGA